MCVCDQVKPSAPRLFEGMEDEDSDDYDDDTRFNIRPQFEGEAGHKVRKPSLFSLSLQMFLIFGYIVAGVLDGMSNARNC